MGTQKKTAKGRLDKFYKLAKEQGYRARSAFKLVHLNRKYDLLSKSKCCIDLCAAPGGWLQVAEKYMPKGSLILGVDLNAIKPIPHVTTFVSDITTPQCRQIIRSHLHDWKADLVLHDGAPNVGSAWVQDAFTQNELVLQSLKLATEFLVKGGNFVTKVFRSQDYNALMWVFGQLFKSVEATKPPSSRNVSAEIFVVCQDFLAPKHIDPKFLDPKHVFKDVAPLPTSITTPAIDASNPDAGPSTSNSISQSANAIAKSQSGSAAHANVFMPEKKRRHREGYAEGELTNFHAGTATEFIRNPDPVGVLGTWNKIEFRTEEEKAWLKSRHTTSDIVANCEDLKVLGKGDFKALIKWRLAIRLEMGLDVRAEQTQDATTEEITVEPIDEEQEISDELKRLQDLKASRQKRERKRANEKKARDLLKLQLNMTAPEDLDNEDRDLAGEEMFDLGEGEREAVRRGRKGGMEAHLAEQDGMSGSDSSDSSSGEEEEDDEVFDSDEERELRLGALEGQIDGMYDDYQSRMAERDAKFRVKQARLKDRNFDAWHGVGKKDGNASDSDAEGDDGVDKGYRNQMVRQPRRGDPDPEEEEEEEEEGGWNIKMAAKARVGESDSDSSDDEGARPAKKARKGKSTHFGSDDEGPAAASAVSGKSKGKGKANGLVTSLNEQQDRAQMSRQAQLWFDQGVFKGMGDLAALDGEDEEEEEEEEEEKEDEESEGEEDGMEVDSDDSDAVYAQGRKTINGNGKRTAGSDDDEMDIDGDADGFEIVPAALSDSEAEWDVDDEDQDEVKRRRIADKGLLTAEAVTMATALVNRQTTLSQMVDDGFNRQSGYHKDGLPTWFLDDETKHYKANIPVTKEAMAALRERQRALDARPIKKVAEAKARKKMKAHARLEKAKKKADGVMDSEDLSMKEKARAVAKAMGRGKAGVKTQEKKVVVARGVNRGVKGRPKGVKGRYKIVDPRMRKETRALKRIKKSTAKKRG